MGIEAVLPALIGGVGDLAAGGGAALGELGAGVAGGLGDLGAGLAGGLGGSAAGSVGGSLAGGLAGAGEAAGGGIGGALGSAVAGDVGSLGGLGTAADALLPVNATLDSGANIGIGGSALAPGADNAIAGATGALPAIGGAAPTVPGAVGGAGASAFDSLGLGSLSKVAPLLGIGGLGYNLYQGYQNKQNMDALVGQENANAANARQLAAYEEGSAQPLLSGGAQLMQYLQTGTLPQAFQSQVDQVVAAAKARVIQGYATRNMSTDPNQNSALAQDLANVDEQGLTLKSNLESTLSTAGNQMVQTANGLLNSGLSATEFGSELPIRVAQLSNQLNQTMAQSIAQFAAALNGGGKGYNPNSLTINLNPNTGGLTGIGSANG